MARVWCAVLVGLASCAVRAPAPVNVDALLAARGPVEARRALQIRVIGDPRDVAGRLALAELDERIGRPSEAIDALEAVVALGGPLGVRWHSQDQARLARLIAARGRARLARGAASALADLERARSLGAAIPDDDLRAARVAGAIAALHHSDAETREGGRRRLALALMPPPSAAPPASGDATPAASRASPPRGEVGDWLGARAGASPEQRGRFGAWLWQHGARRAAWDELSAWHAATRPPRDLELQGAYLIAARWWIPLERPGPSAEDLVGPARCAFAVCAPHEAVDDDLAERAYLLAPLPPPVRDPIEVAALATITLHQALRGETSWGAALAARVDIAAVTDPAQLAKLPRSVQPLLARLVGRDVPIPSEAATADDRLLLAATRLLAGSADIDALVAGSPYTDVLRRIAVPRAPFTGDAVAEAVARHAERTVPGDAAASAPARPTELTVPGDAAASAPARPTELTVPGDAAASAPARPTELTVPGDAAASARARHGELTVPVDAAAQVPAALPAITRRPTPSPETLRAIVIAYRRDPLIADRLGRDAVAEAADTAAVHAMLGALFDALGDPARARAAWQAAVDASPEPAFVRGLAEAQARQGDADAALINATTAAAASGDPAIVWTSVARSLLGVGKYAHALQAARSAIDLSGAETLAAALDVAIAASRALGRDAQAASLSRQRARMAPDADAPESSDAIDMVPPPRNRDPAGPRGTSSSTNPSGTRAAPANNETTSPRGTSSSTNPSGTRAAPVNEATTTHGTSSSTNPSGTREAPENNDATSTRARSVLSAGDPTDARAALVDFRTGASDATVARLWVASRWNPRNVRIRAVLLAAIARDDPRSGVVVGELVDLAGDRDPDVRRAAVAALR